MYKENYLTTGQLAKRTGITVRTLRYYDQIGLLIPENHHAGSIRSYNMKDLEKLQQIQTLKYLGLSLQEIKDILDAESLSIGVDQTFITSTARCSTEKNHSYGACSSCNTRCYANVGQSV